MEDRSSRSAVWTVVGVLVIVAGAWLAWRQFEAAAPDPADTGAPAGVQLTATPVAVGASASDESFADLTPPRWLNPPTPDQIAAVYPADARRAAAEGAVTVTCMIDVVGNPDGCRVVESSNPAYGFDMAALGLSKGFRFAPATSNDRPIPYEAEVEVPFRLR